MPFLAGCSGTRKSNSGARDVRNPPEFALPGIPMKNELLADPSEVKNPETSAAPAEEAKPAEAKPDETIPAETPPAEARTAQANPVEPKPEQAKPAAATAEPSGDLKYHLDAAARYSVRRQYRSAAAEYGAAVPFLPAGDARAVHLLERQGAMMLKAGNEPKAQEQFLSAIEKAKELSISGLDLTNSYLGLGYCQEKAKKIADAISSYEKALELSTSQTVKDRLANTISDLKKASK